MLNALSGQFEIRAIERIGHDSLYPVTDNWPHLERELVAAIEQHSQPVVLLGHSLGGLLSIAVALARPELVRAVVILDAPVLAGWRAWLFRMLKLSGRDARYSPAAATLRRRVEFDSLDAARRHFRSKAVFANLDEEVLTDYLGRPEDPALPLRLSFDAAIEARIYRTLPHTLARRMRRGSRVPIGFLAGTRSTETRLVGLSAARAPGWLAPAVDRWQSSVSARKATGCRACCRIDVAAPFERAAAALRNPAAPDAVRRTIGAARGLARMKEQLCGIERRSMPACKSILETVLSATPRRLFVQCITPAGLHRMAYTEWGDPNNGKVLVCVHGLTRVGADFDELAEAMSDQYRVICPDVVGRGYSDWLTNSAYYQTPVYISDMVTLLARVNADTVHWFGTSMGGIIGMGLASLPHNPIQRMVLNDVGPLIKAAALERIGSYVGRGMHFDSLDDAKLYISTVAASFGEHTDQQWSKLTEDAVRPDQDKGGVRLHYDPALGDVFRQGNGLQVADVVLWDYYDKITCPVLAVRGISSDLLTVETHQEMAMRGPRAELVTIEKAGHAPTFVTAPQIAIARRFLLAEGAS